MFGGLLGVFPVLKWKNELPKVAWNRNLEHSGAGRGGMNTDKLPLDSCAYTLLKKVSDSITQVGGAVDAKHLDLWPGP